MSGMLGALAGLGKGLAQVGEDSLKSIQREEEQKRNLDLEDLRAKRRHDYELDKMREADELKDQREEKRAKALSDADDKATTRAKELGTARRMEDFKAKLGQTDATEAELQEAFKQYDNKAVQVGEKTDTQFMDKHRADAAGDYVKAARETGNTGLLSQAKQSMDAAMKQDSEEAKAAQVDRKMTETERANAERERLSAERLEKIITGKSGSASEVREAINFLDFFFF